MRFVLFTLAAVLTVSAFSVQAKMYKWVDKDGQMHFGDKVPEEYLNKEHDELNASGTVIKHNAAAKTLEQKIQENRLAREREKEALIKRKKQQRDRVLLDTYTTERDLTVARDSRLDAVASQIRLADSIISDSNKKLESMEQQVIDIQASNRKVPPFLLQRIKNEKEQVKVQSKVKKTHEKRRNEIAIQFSDYIKRFKVLKAEQKAKRKKHAIEQGY